MTTKNLYKSIRPDGGITVSITPPDSQEYTELFRLIADEGKMITKDGIIFVSCTDTTSPEEWYEVLYDFENEKSIQNITSDIIEKAKAYDELMGVKQE